MKKGNLDRALAGILAAIMVAASIPGTAMAAPPAGGNAAQAEEAAYEAGIKGENAAAKADAEAAVTGTDSITEEAEPDIEQSEGSEPEVPESSDEDTGIEEPGTGTEASTEETVTEEEPSEQPQVSGNRVDVIKPGVSANNLKKMMSGVRAEDFQIKFPDGKGNKIEINFDSIPENQPLPSGDVIVTWYCVDSQSNESTKEFLAAGTGTLKERLKNMGDGAVFMTGLQDCGNQFYVKITYNDTGSNPVELVSNRVQPAIKLSGNSKALGIINGEPEFVFSETITLNYRWNRIYENGTKELIKEKDNFKIYSGHNLSEISYRCRDMDVGKGITLSLSIDKEKWFESDKLTVSASDYTESFDWKEPNVVLDIQDDITKDYLNCSLEKFKNEQQADSEVFSYLVKVFISDDPSTDTPVDDKEILGSKITSMNYLDFTPCLLKDEYLGKYCYVQLESDDFRRPEYKTGISGKIGKSAFSLDNEYQRIGSPLRATGIPKKYYSKGDYSYQIVRTAAGTDVPQTVVGEGKNNSATFDTDYKISDGDTGSYLNIKLKTNDGKIYDSVSTNKISSRKLELSGTAKAGKSVGIDPQSVEKIGDVDTAVEYEYYITEKKDEETSITTVDKGSLTVKNAYIKDIVPSYTIKDREIGKYINLKLTLSVGGAGHTYEMQMPDPVKNRTIHIEGSDMEGGKVELTDHGGIIYNNQIRYTWRTKADGGAAASETEGEAVAGGRAENKDGFISVPAYSIKAGDAGKYLFLVLTSDKMVWMSENITGPFIACAKMEGKVLLSGEAVTGETLSASWEGVSQEQGFRFEWYKADSDIKLGNGPEYTIKEEDEGSQIYVKAVGDGQLYRGSIASNRTVKIISRYSPENTGIKAIKGKLKNTVPLGFNSDGSRETVELAVTVYGVKRLPKDYRIAAAVNGKELEIDKIQSTPGTAGTDNIPLAVILNSDDFKAGSNTVEIWLSENGERIRGISSKLTVQALEEIKLKLKNKSAEGNLQLVKGKKVSLKIEDNCGGKVKLTYQLPEGVKGITVDAAGTVSADVQNTDAGTIISVSAVSTENEKLRGELKVPVTIVDAEVPVKELKLSYDSSTDKAVIQSALKKLSLGYNSDPRKTDESGQDSLTLDAIASADATANYVVIWKSSDETAAVVSQDGKVSVKGQGKQVTISASVGEVSDSITFTTAVTKYVPAEIIYQTKKLTVEEQSYTAIQNLKVKYLVDGKTYRTFKMENTAFTFVSDDSNRIKVDSEGRIFAHSYGTGVDSKITIRLTGSDITKEIPVAVKEKQYKSVNFTLKEHYITAEADAKGVLQGKVLLYEGTDVPGDLRFQLENATAMILSEEHTELSRDIDLSKISLNIDKKYKVNKEKKYALIIPGNKQKLVLTVTIADTQPEYVSGEVLYTGLEIETPVTFSVYPGTKIYSAAVSNGSKVTVTSWSQNGNTVTVWLKCNAGITKGKLLTNFIFQTADIVAKEVKEKKVLNVPLVAADIPDADMIPAYITGKAFPKEGYPLKNNSELDTKYFDISEKEWTEVIGQYTNGYYTIYPDQPASSTNSAYKDMFEIKDGSLVLKQGKEAAAIPAGDTEFLVNYQYGAENSANTTTGTKTAAFKVHFKDMEIKEKILTLTLKKDAMDEEGNAYGTSISFPLYSHRTGTAQTDKKEIQKYALSLMDSRYKFSDNETYTLFWSETGKPVAGVTLEGGPISSGSPEGLYRDILLYADTTSELVKNYGGTPYSTGTFEIRIARSNTDTEQVKAVLTPELEISESGPAITPDRKISSFNQTEFNQQEVYIPYGTGNESFAPEKIETVLEKAPQMVDPFVFGIEKGIIHVYGDYYSSVQGTKMPRTPAAGNYIYRCKAVDEQGISTGDFVITLKIAKAVQNIVVKAKVSGSLNPSYYNDLTKEGMIYLEFTSNVPNLEVNVEKGLKLLESSKKSTEAVTGRNLISEGVVRPKSGKGNNSIYLCTGRTYEFRADCNYIPADIKVSVGDSYTAVFKQLKPVSIKTIQKGKGYQHKDWDLSEGNKKQGIKLEYAMNDSETAYSYSDPIDPLERLIEGTELYRKIGGEYVKVNADQVAMVETLKLAKASQKNFAITGYGSGTVDLEVINSDILKSGKQKVSYEIIPASSSVYAKQKVYDTAGNELYSMTEDFNGKEKYSSAVITIPKSVMIQQEINFYYGKVKNPSVQ